MVTWLQCTYASTSAVHAEVMKCITSKTQPYLLEVVSSLHVDSHGRKHDSKLLLAFFFPVLWPKAAAQMWNAVQTGVSSAIR